MQYYEDTYTFENGASVELAPGIQADVSYEYPSEYKVVLLVQGQSVTIAEGVVTYFTYDNVIHCVEGSTLGYTVFKNVIEHRELGETFYVRIHDSNAEVYTDHGLTINTRRPIRIPGGRLACCSTYELKGTTRGVKKLYVQRGDEIDVLNFKIL